MPLIIEDAITDLTDRLKAFMSGDTPAFEEEEIERVIDRCVKEYALHKPLRGVEVVTLTSGVATYDFPEDVESVLPVVVLNQETPHILFASVPIPIHEFTTFFAHFFESPALQVRSEVYQARFYRNIRGTIRVDENNRTFTVSPVPTVSQSVKIPVTYAFEKEQPDMYALEEYTKIPNGHTGCILDLCEATLLRSLAKAFSANNMKVGDRDFRGSFTARDLIAQADDLEERFRAKMVLPIASR